MNKAKYINTYKEKNGILVTYYSVYEYRGEKYYVNKTGISHIDKESHRMKQSHIDAIIKARDYKETEEYKNKHNSKDDLNEFFKLIDID